MSSNPSYPAEHRLLKGGSKRGGGVTATGDKLLVVGRVGPLLIAPTAAHPDQGRC